MPLTCPWNCVTWLSNWVKSYNNEKSLKMIACLCILRLCLGKVCIGVIILDSVLVLVRLRMMTGMVCIWWRLRMTQDGGQWHQTQEEDAAHSLIKWFSIWYLYWNNFVPSLCVDMDTCDWLMTDWESWIYIVLFSLQYDIYAWHLCTILTTL